MSKRYVLLLGRKGRKTGMARLDRGQGSNGRSSRPQGGILFRNHTPSRRRDLRGREERERKEREKKKKKERTGGPIDQRLASERNDETMYLRGAKRVVKLFSTTV